MSSVHDPKFAEELQEGLVKAGYNPVKVEYTYANPDRSIGPKDFTKATQQISELGTLNNLGDFSVNTNKRATAMILPYPPDSFSTTKGKKAQIGRKVDPSDYFELFGTRRSTIETPEELAQILEARRKRRELLDSM